LPEATLANAIADTPALMIDRAAFQANLATMARLARERGIALRPHAKSHKSVTIAKAQMEAGAVGQCCAKLGEIEVMAAAGVRGLLLTTPMRGEAKIRRLQDVLRIAPDTMIVVEDVAAVQDLAQALAASDQQLDVMIDVDVGTHRTGLTSVEAALDVARAIAASPSLRLKGVQGYAGHVQSIRDYAERRARSHEALSILGGVRDGLEKAGFPCAIVSGGGTGTHDFDHEIGVLNELQVGSYLFSDVVYDTVAMTPDGEKRWRNSLFVVTSVLSSQHQGFATTDAGIKSFATDGPAPVLHHGAPQGASYALFGDEMGRVILADPAARLPIGTRVACVIPHCDPNVNLFDRYVVVEGGQVVDSWPIEARGKVA
jgi:D-serine deaminase-like pyridoxal phosphate-dependent protein